MMNPYQSGKMIDPITGKEIMKGVDVFKAAPREDRPAGRNWDVKFDKPGAQWNPNQSNGMTPEERSSFWKQLHGMQIPGTFNNQLPINNQIDFNVKKNEQPQKTVTSNAPVSDEEWRRQAWADISGNNSSSQTYNPADMAALGPVHQQVGVPDNTYYGLENWFANPFGDSPFIGQGV